MSWTLKKKELCPTTRTMTLKVKTRNWSPLTVLKPVRGILFMSLTKACHISSNTVCWMFGNFIWCKRFARTVFQGLTQSKICEKITISTGQYLRQKLPWWIVACPAHSIVYWLSHVLFCFCFFFFSNYDRGEWLQGYVLRKKHQKTFHCFIYSNTTNKWST